MPNTPLLGSSMSIMGGARVTGNTSVMNYVAMSSSLSVRAFGRIGSKLSVLNQGHVGSSFSLRSFVRAGTPHHCTVSQVTVYHCG